MSDAHNIVSVSGGKDSTALLALAVVQDVPNLQAVFADTGHEHRLTYDYLGYLSDWLQRQGHRPIRTIRADFSDDFARRRDYLYRVASGEIEDRFGKRRHTPHSAARAAAAMAPTGNPFMDLALLKGRFPSTKVRFCSEKLKRNPIIEQVLLPLLGDSLVLSWQGVRAQESEARSHLPECDEVGGRPVQLPADPALDRGRCVRGPSLRRSGAQSPVQDGYEAGGLHAVHQLRQRRVAEHSQSLPGGHCAR